MKAVAPSTDYYNRLVKKLDEQETQIEGWQKELDTLRKQIDAERKDLESQVSQLTING
jgi:septal ring factor EnvC (AmiA/AmiB activator)